MKLREALTKVNKDKKFKDTVDIAELASSQFYMNDVYNYDWNQSRLIAYFTGSWYCTDTYVGYRIYFLDDEPVAISYQGGRKSDEVFQWISEEGFKKVKEFLSTLRESSEDHFTVCNLDENISTYTIDFNGQLFEYHMDIALYNGENVKIIEAKDEDANGLRINHIVKIQYSDNRIETVDLRDLEFPFNLITE